MNLKEAKANLEKAEEANKQSQDQFATVSAQYSDIQSNIKVFSDELKEVEARPDSNIDLKFQQLRDELVQSLGFSKENCVYIGELIDVDQQHRDWHGAIERALGGIRTTLAVPDHSFSMVTKWLNTRHTGLHVRVQVVDKSASKQVNFKPDGYLTKLVWRDHPYQGWLKSHLARFDLQCVSSTDILDRTPFSMTMQGLIQKEKGRFEKKDLHKISDRRNWFLGFSNKSRVALLKNDIANLSQQLVAKEKEVQLSREQWNLLVQKKGNWEKLLAFQWVNINAPYWDNKCSGLKEDILQLEKAGGDLDKAKTRWEQAKQQLAALSNDKIALVNNKGRQEQIIKDAEYRLEKAKADAAAGLTDVARNLLKMRVGVLSNEALDQLGELREKFDKQLDQLLDTWRTKKSSAEKSAIGIMSSFRSHEKWQVFSVDWLSDIASIEEYIEHYNKLEKEGLPNLVEQFVERLNKHATQSLARIQTKLESEREEIVERTDVINQVLKRTEFKSGSYLKLGVKKEKYPHVAEFEKQIRKVLSQVTSEDHEARYQQLVKVVAILEKASSAPAVNTLESLRLLDPRYQMSFYAEEIDLKTNEVRDVLESSTGKSGGEKESFAGTIVAASLAYVLTPDGHERPVYSTVFLDEAFSNTAEAVSKRVLRVFKELHIHVNLITPYKNINLAREYAQSLLIVERDQHNHDSRLYEVTWEEIDQKFKELHRQKLLKSAEGLGVQLEDIPADEVGSHAQ